MRKLICTGLFSIFTFLSLFTQGRVNPKHHYVKGHYRNGTFVEGHHRTNPNSTNRDNYSTRGNTNPWTGQPGWITPDNKPLPSYSTLPSYTPATGTRISSLLSTLKNSTTPTNKTTDNNWQFDYSTPSTPRYSSYSTASYPTYRTWDLSAGERVINYTNGRDEFSVAAPTKIAFDKNLTYHSFDPYNNELKESTGVAEGQLLLNGPYRFYDEKGRLRNSANYRLGLKHGRAITYGENGDVTLLAEYTSGKLTYQKFTAESGITFELFGELNKPGTRLMLYKEGALFKRIETISKDLDKTIEFDPETQHKLAEYNKLGGEIHGKVLIYNPDGQTLSEVANFNNGMREGETRIYGENGKLSEKLTCPKIGLHEK